MFDICVNYWLLMAENTCIVDELDLRSEEYIDKMFKETNFASLKKAILGEIKNDIFPMLQSGLDSHFIKYNTDVNYNNNDLMSLKSTQSQLAKVKIKMLTKKRNMLHV